MISKISTRVLPAFLLSCLITVLLNSCQKEERFGLDPQVQPRTSLLGKSRVFFEKNILRQAQDDQRLQARPKALRHRVAKTPLWHQAVKVQLSIGEGLKVPLAYSEEINLLIGPNKEEVPLAELSYLLLYKDRQQQWKAEVVTQVPDADYWAHRHGPNQAFSGIIIVEDWWGRPIKTFKKLAGRSIIKLGNPSFAYHKNKGEVQHMQAIEEDCDVIVGTGPEGMYTVEFLCEVHEGGAPDSDSGGSGGGGWGGPGGLGGGGYGDGGFGGHGGGGGGNGPNHEDYDERPHGGGGGDRRNDNPPPPPPGRRSDINNNVSDPCLRRLVQDLRLADLAGTASDIISALDENVKVKISIKDSIRTQNGAPANTSRFRYNPNTMEFSATTVLNQEIILPSTKEYAAAIIVHEIIHSYFNYFNKVPKLGEVIEHEVMAREYIKPMANFLSQLFGISLQDGTALAWSGLGNAKSYMDYENFDFPGGTMSKTEMNRISGNYASKYSGTSLCTPSSFE